MEDTLRTNGYSIESSSSIEECSKKENDNTLIILPNMFFSPKSYQTGIITKTEQTYSIHHFAASWVNKYDNQSFISKIWKFFHLPNTDIRKKISIEKNNT